MRGAAAGETMKKSRGIRVIEEKVRDDDRIEHLLLTRF